MKRTTKVRISLLLVVCMLLSGLPNAASVSAIEADEPMTNFITEGTPTEPLAVSKEATVTEEIPVLQLDADCQILNHVDPEVFAAGNHIARLPEKETLSSYVFLNADGTQTVYYMDQPVKFEKADGTVVEKNLTLAAATEGYTTTQNDVQLTIPTNPTNGIRLVYDNHQITLIPQGGTLANAAQATDNSVTYPNYYGEGMSLRYTPTLSGVKEDILLDAYSGVNSFTFRLNTGGLNLYQANGRYYLAESKTATERIELGDVVSYDANSKFSIGNMTAQTIMPGQAYMLTLTVDEAFLTDENTTYPVTIDPTLTVSYGNNGNDYIIDAPIFEGYPNNNYGAFQYNRVGYVDSSYQSGRTVVQLPVLTSSSIYTSLAAENITSVKFYVKEATGTSGISVRLYPLVSLTTWTESTVTWNNLGACDSVVVDTQTLTDSAWSAFDITELVKKWKTGFYSGTHSFIMIGANEDSTDKSFCSSEHEKTNYRPYVVMTYGEGTGGGSDFSSAVSLLAGNTVSVTTAYANEKRYFKFTPTITANYIIQSSNYSGDPKVKIYDSNFQYVDENDDAGEELNFRLSITLSAGITYYIAAEHAVSKVGTYSLTVLQPIEIDAGFYRFKNVGSNLYIDIHGPDEQIYLHQWTYHSGAQEIWFLQKQSNGYYTIRSQFGENRYIGVSDSSTSTSNIQLFSEVSYKTLWNIYITHNGLYLFEPAYSLGKVVCAPNTTNGAELQLSWMGHSDSYTKWKVLTYGYSDVLTFSAFDVGDSTANEASFVNEWMTMFGFTNIGAYSNADELIQPETIKTIGRYSDIIYINGHGSRFANMQIQYGPKTDTDGDGEVDDGSNIISYLCADDSVNTGNSIRKVGIGADWLAGSTTKTESFWNLKTKWGILAQCSQLDYVTNAPDARQHWYDTYYSAQVWGRTMLGDGERIHGYVGYYNSAPGGSTHLDRLEEFFNLCYYDEKAIVLAWSQAHTRLIGSSSWAAIYHTANEEDTFQTMVDCTPSGSSYTISYIARGGNEPSLPLSTIENVSLLSEITSNNTVLCPMFVDASSTNPSLVEKTGLSSDEIYLQLQNKLDVTDNSELQIEGNGRIAYHKQRQTWAEKAFEYELSNEEAVELAERYLSALGLAPEGEYRATVSKIQRCELNLDSNEIPDMETVEYTISFYRTYNGVDLISDQEDGIVISFNDSGVTELRYLWRDIDLITSRQSMTGKTISTDQALRICQAELGQETEIFATSEKFDIDSMHAYQAYLQVDDEVRPVYVFATDAGYTDCLFVDMYTGEVITLS